MWCNNPSAAEDDFFQTTRSFRVGISKTFDVIGKRHLSVQHRLLLVCSWEIWVLKISGSGLQQIVKYFTKLWRPQPIGDVLVEINLLQGWPPVRRNVTPTYGAQWPAAAVGGLGLYASCQRQKLSCTGATNLLPLNTN